MNSGFARSLLAPLALLATLLLPACAKIQLTTIPEPPPTAKLRVFVLALTGPGKWITPHAEFAAATTRIVGQHLKETGIYEVVSSEDVHAVLGNQDLARWQMASGDWSTAREIAKALHADYAMIIERSIGSAAGGHDFFVDNVMINTETGKKYGSWYILPRVTARDRDKTIQLVRATHRNIFRSAKEDMLATAIKKGKRLAQQQVPAAAPAIPQRPAPAAPLVQKKVEPQPGPLIAQEPTAPTPAQQASGPKPIKPAWMHETILDEGSTQRTEVAKGTKLVVYDLESPEPFRPAALILTEALREELFILKKYILVNRENLQKVLEEMALQQTGLLDDRQAVKTGKGLAANQVVTGRLGLLGKTYVLQAKRIDVETFATLGLTSTKFQQGEEDTVLSRMPDLARKLSGL